MLPLKNMILTRSLALRNPISFKILFVFLTVKDITAVCFACCCAFASCFCLTKSALDAGGNKVCCVLAEAVTLSSEETARNRFLSADERLMGVIVLLLDVEVVPPSIVIVALIYFFLPEILAVVHVVKKVKTPSV